MKLSTFMMALAALVAVTDARGVFLARDAGTERAAQCIKQYAGQRTDVCGNTHACTELWDTCIVYNEANNTYDWLYPTTYRHGEDSRGRKCYYSIDLYHAVTSCWECKIDNVTCILESLDITRSEWETCTQDRDKCSEDNESLFNRFDTVEEALNNPDFLDKIKDVCNKRICLAPAPSPISSEPHVKEVEIDPRGMDRVQEVEDSVRRRKLKARDIKQWYREAGGRYNPIIAPAPNSSEPCEFLMCMEYNAERAKTNFIAFIDGITVALNKECFSTLSCALRPNHCMLEYEECMNKPLREASKSNGDWLLYVDECGWDNLDVKTWNAQETQEFCDMVHRFVVIYGDKDDIVVNLLRETEHENMVVAICGEDVFGGYD